ncbi:SDR family NAD(P)-dependent oxidoreductase [Pseudomonas aeruginosa]|uniref:SDR family NAD(P)-dependent oxidoreductase n=1 Tax=Pseudomonas aeruginosa TaxID=287 RepID=UPI0003B9C652|nr:SDR family oxidoreductase [Pseudomonas aeruginosa]EJM8826843.1 SDR family oxidoreductase [Pseudomonas aeruginosa]EKT8061466.1 SDR family oxidoreductase [Pseudomonas aeruginosa]EKU7998594.1 SDR family oxidoreductase [Pseudomonas aeruginosa]EKU8275013.1 SDR family oxidoreductase [Pseudomonas aeruginosa]EKV2965826.1 SDR family oxidoreductase [Pseudomonas aeruginosa]
MNLMNKVAVVTGGGRGIGRGITEKLLLAGAQVLIAQRQALDEELRTHPNVAWCEADLADREAPYLVARAVKQRFGGADILVNNAGFMFEQSLDEMSEDDWDRMMAVNMRAPVFLAKALLPQMRERGGGSIINIGSIEGIGANPWHTAYCGSKAGVHGFTRAMAVDLGRDGVRCNAIAPGWINSDLSNAYIDGQADPDQARRDLLKLHPVGRTGEPQDIGNAVVFLGSEESAFITGQVIVIDGGRTAKLPLPF